MYNLEAMSCSAVCRVRVVSAVRPREVARVRVHYAKFSVGTRPVLADTRRIENLTVCRVCVGIRSAEYRVRCWAHKMHHV